MGHGHSGSRKRSAEEAATGGGGGGGSGNDTQYGREHKKHQTEEKLNNQSRHQPYKHHGANPPKDRTGVSGYAGDHVQRPKNRDSHEVSTHPNSSSSSSSSRQLPPLPTINDPALLSAVFTHQTFLTGHITTKLDTTYDRLELLGDAYIELFASRLVYTHYPDVPAGRLSQKRELLIKNETLAEYALAYGFESRIRIAPGFLSGSGVNPKIRTKILGDVFEAYIAALMHSSSSSSPDPTAVSTPTTSPIDRFSEVEQFLHTLWLQTKLLPLPKRDTLPPPDPTAKVQLANRLMGRGTKLDYRQEALPDTSQKREGKLWFHVAVFVTGWGFEDVRLGGGKGLSLTEAGLYAALEALGAEVTEQVAKIRAEVMGRDKGTGKGKGDGGGEKEGEGGGEVG